MPNETKHTQWIVTDQAPIDGLNLQGLKSVCIKRGETYVTVAEIISADDAELIARAPTLLAENETLLQQNAELVRALKLAYRHMHMADHLQSEYAHALQTVSDTINKVQS